MRMTGAEAIMWAVEKDPALRSDFMNITVLEGPPDEARLRERVARAVVEIPRLAQRVVSPPLRLAPPEWRHDPTFDLDYHLRKVAVPAPGGHRELLDLAATLAANPLDRSRPLWEFTLVEGLDEGRCALLQKVHHTITDGVGALRLSMVLVDLAPEPAAPGPLDVLVEQEADPVDHTSPLEVLTDALGYVVDRERALLRKGVSTTAELLLHPERVPERAEAALALTGSLRRQVLVTDPGHSPLLAPRSLGRRFETFSVSLEATQDTAARSGATVNDVYVAGLAGALALYHGRMGVPVDELRMAMPVSVRRSGDVDANRFVPTRVLLPLRPADALERLAAVRERLSELRTEPALEAADSVSSILVLLPTALLVAATRSQARTIDFAASNLRGSPVELYVGGARIAASYPMGPRTGSALNVTLLSYDADMHMGLNLDPASITEPELLLECFAESFDALLAPTAPAAPTAPTGPPASTAPTSQRDSSSSRAASTVSLHSSKSGSRHAG